MKITHNKTTTIHFSLSRPQFVSDTVYGFGGQCRPSRYCKRFIHDSSFSELGGNIFYSCRYHDSYSPWAAWPIFTAENDFMCTED